MKEKTEKIMRIIGIVVIVIGAVMLIQPFFKGVIVVALGALLYYFSRSVKNKVGENPTP